MNIELFPCSGGMAEGFRRAGVVFDFAFDKDPNAVESYHRNHGHRPVQMDVNDLMAMVQLGWRPERPLRLLVADPPCTPWSRAGKRQGLEDERDCLQVTADLIRLLRPRAYLIGNIPGLQDSTSWHVVQDVIGGLANDGYCVADYISLDAADYGVPQHRVRPFWFGHLDGPCVRWPAPTHGAPTEQLAIGGHALIPWVTCRQALGHLPLEQLGRPVRMTIRPKGQDGRKNGGDESRCSAPDAPAATVVSKDTRKGGAILRLPDPNRPPTAADETHRSITTQAATTAVLEWPWDRPSTSVAATDERLPSPGHHATGTGHSTQHGPNAIILSELAAKILQGFPEDWLFSGDTKKARWSQLGQAMPPPLAHAVARAVVEQMRAVDATAGPPAPITDLADADPEASSGGPRETGKRPSARPKGIEPSQTPSLVAAQAASEQQGDRIRGPRKGSKGRIDASEDARTPETTACIDSGEDARGAGGALRGAQGVRDLRDSRETGPGSRRDRDAGSPLQSLQRGPRTPSRQSGALRSSGGLPAEPAEAKDIGPPPDQETDSGTSAPTQDAAACSSAPARGDAGSTAPAEAVAGPLEGDEPGDLSNLADAGEAETGGAPGSAARAPYLESGVDGTTGASGPASPTASAEVLDLEATGQGAPLRKRGDGATPETTPAGPAAPEAVPTTEVTHATGPGKPDVKRYANTPKRLDIILVDANGTETPLEMVP